MYNEIYALSDRAFDPENFEMIGPVIRETFVRLAYNLQLIKQELDKINYQFIPAPRHDFEKPLTPPHPDVESLLKKLKTMVAPGGHIPLSLEYFYRIVGSCNFCWDYKTDPDIRWESADPIDIPPIQDLLEMAGEVAEDEDFLEEGILISGDYLQKDNISGSTYNLVLTPTPSIDCLITGWDIPFIEYLRLTSSNCGFTMAPETDYQSLNDFCKKLRPQLLDI